MSRKLSLLPICLVLLCLGVMPMVFSGCSGGSSGGGGAPPPSNPPPTQQVTLLSSIQSNLSGVQTDSSHQVALPGSVLLTSVTGQDANGNTVTVGGSGLNIRVAGVLFLNSDVTTEMITSGDKIEIYEEANPSVVVVYTHS